jgi:uncharacterized protein (TIGR03083 family)
MADMDVTEHIEVLRGEGELMADAVAAAAAGAPVPSCPDWVVRDLVHHQGAVHRWATAFVAGAKTDPVDVSFEEVTGPKPSDGDLADWLRQGHAALVTTLAEASPDVQCWAFMPAASPLAFWARRQAHETSIHRVDAELAAGRRPQGVEPRFGADGVDELLTGFVVRRKARRPTDAPKVLLVSCTDAEGHWRVTVDGEQITAEAAAATNDADCVLRGGASHLYQALWNRRSLNGIELGGDPDVLDRVVERPIVTWE